MAIAAAAFGIELPFFFRGWPSGHDFEFHLYTWLEVLSQWKQGIVYPRWAALAQFGYGEPRFIFYPPASWTLGAGLSAVFPWRFVPGIYIWIVLVAAGASMFLLARPWLDRRDATFAAVLYAVNPYHLLIVYWRSAFAELLASCLMPLLLLLLLRAGEKGRRTSLSLGILLAAAWLVNAPSAVMIHYSLALLTLVIAWQRRSARVFLTAGAAVLLGAGLAGFYLLPAIYEQKWVTIAQAVAAGLRPMDSFLFTHTADADHNRFNYLASSVAAAEIFLAAIAAWTARRWRDRHRELWISLVAWGAVCAALMLPITLPVWNALPKLAYVQFPWRWMLCLGVPFSLLTALGIRRLPCRVAVYGAALCVIVLAGMRFQPPWWDTAADLREMQDNMASGAGYEGVDEYVPLGADPYNVDKRARLVTVVGPAEAAIQVARWKPELKVFSAAMSGAETLALRLFNYPAWKVEVNGHCVDVGMREGTGQMLVPVGAGANLVQISFVRTWDRRLGAWVSGISVLLVLIRKRYSTV
ncbi:MAG: 6-pyruvoyl-tetrahydropterin synthase-related protein [Candidatus Sulfotelmatobacter sp.]|jgi:hypothetical protein